MIDLPRALGHAVRAACARASAATPMRSLPLLVPARVRVAEAILDRFDPEAVTRYGFVLRRAGPDLVSVLELPRGLRYCDPATLARAVVEAEPDGVPDALARHAGDAVPADPAERDALLRELLARPEEVLGSAAARELRQKDVARLFAR